MQLHQIKPIHKEKKGKRIGRGGKRGTYSGRGIKGQRARAGRKFKPIIRELIKKYHKLPGYKFKSSKEKMVILNVAILEKKFEEGEKINPKILFEKGLISKIKGKLPKVKILGKGEIKKRIIVENCFVSNPAKAKIEKSGGKIL